MEGWVGQVGRADLALRVSCWIKMKDNVMIVEPAPQVEIWPSC